MVNAGIVKYLTEGVRRGFDISMLRQELIRGGFKEEDINEAIDYLSKIGKKKSSRPISIGKKSVVKNYNKNQLGKVKESSLKMKWIKIAGWTGFIFFILSLFVFIVSLVSFGGNFFDFIISSKISLVIVTIFISLMLIFYYFGFIKLGKNTNSKLLKFAGWSMIILNILFLAIWIISEIAGLQINSLNEISTFQISFLISILILTVSYLIIQMVFSIGLIKIRESVKFAKLSGIIGIVRILIFIVVGVSITLLLLKVIKNPVSALSIIANRSILLLLLLYTLESIEMAEHLFKALTLFDGSKKFEN